MINLNDVQEKMKENERQRLLSKHKYKIFFDEKDNRWKTTVPDETKKNGRRLIAKRDRQDLDDVLASYYAEIEDNLYVSDNLYTLEKLFPIWLKYKATQTNATSYCKRIVSDWNKYYKDTPISKELLIDLTYVKLNEWAHEMIKKNSLNKKQYYNMSVIIRQCLEYACADGVNILKSNPFDKVKVNKKLFANQQKPDRKTQVFLNNEQKLISEECSMRFNKKKNFTTPLLILLNFQLGLRIGELVALKWTDVSGNYINISRMEVEDYILEEKDGLITTKPNGYKIVDYTKTEAGTRSVYLNSEAKALLRMIQKVNLTNGYYDDNFIFISSQRKQRGNARTFTTYLEKLCVTVGIINKSNHKIRKTYISSLFDKGINIDTIRRQAGHEDERTSLNNYCFDQNDDAQLEEQLENAKNNTTTLYSSLAL